ncbi:MAG TPA: 23S rRNA (guanosine(2251)-2'-O)-methyltransferase RlmB [Gammaproteobacteria bacterium]
MSTLVYGLHAVRGLLASRPESIRRAKVQKGASTERLGEIEAALESLGIQVERVDRRELDRLTGGGTHQGVVVEATAGGELPLAQFEELVVTRGSALRVLVLDGVEDPRNLGACLRTADAAGIDAVVVPRSRAAKLTPAAVKAATGAAETVPVLRAPNLARVLRWMKAAGVRLVGAEAGGRPLFDTALAPPLALVLGGEGRGLRPLTRELCDELVAIPMHGAVESLNVSVAAAVLMYELARQSPVERPRR